jgi:hypothetical protein
MITLDLLRHRKKTALGLPEIPRKPLAAGISLFIACALLVVLKALIGPDTRVEDGRGAVPAARSEGPTSFERVEGIVEDIRGGRFKARAPGRRGPLDRLSADERKAYERIFVSEAFDVFNGCIRQGMGFNTITLDNAGNFLIYGTSPSARTVHDFRRCLSGQAAVREADAPDFKPFFLGSSLRFTLQGSLNAGTPDVPVGGDTSKAEEALPPGPKAALAGMVKLGKQRGITAFRRVQWGASAASGTGRRHALRIQVECSYGAFIRWVKAVHEKGCPVGYACVNLTSVGDDRILAALEMAVYSRN